MEEEHADDATKLGSSMSSCLPLLVFQHRYHGQEDDDEDVDNEMLMFSISQQSLHKNMEHGLLAVGNSSMCWTTPQGWILLIHAPDHDAAVSSACLWNPSTGDKLPLPDIITEEHEISYHSRCMLSHKDPNHPGCVVVLFSYETPDFWYSHTAGDGGDNGDITRTTSVTMLLYQSHQRGKRPVAVSVLIRKLSSACLHSSRENLLKQLA